MSQREKSRPTESELSILSVLWKRGPCTVRQVNEDLARQKASGYTTTLKLLQIMHEKGLVSRDEKERSHVYSARVAADRIQRTLVDNLLERAFDGSAQKLVMRALSARKTTAAELAEIRRFLDELEEKQREGRGKQA